MLKTLSLCLCFTLLGAVLGQATLGWWAGVSLQHYARTLDQGTAGRYAALELQRAYRGDDVPIDTHDGVSYVRPADVDGEVPLSRTETLLLRWTLQDREAKRILDPQPRAARPASDRSRFLRDAIQLDQAEGRLPVSGMLAPLAAGTAVEYHGGWADDGDILAQLQTTAQMSEMAATAQADLLTLVDGGAQCLVTLGLQDGCGGLFWLAPRTRGNALRVLSPDPALLHHKDSTVLPRQTVSAGGGSARLQSGM